MEPVQTYDIIVPKRGGARIYNVFLADERKAPTAWIWFCQLVSFCWRWLLVYCKPLERLVQLFLGPTPEAMARCSETCDWETAPIRCIAFHPHSYKMALLTREDEVFLYDDPNYGHKCLSDRDQQHSSCVAWRPCSENDLAVGCAAGICLWRLRQHPGHQLRHLGGSHQLQLLANKRHIYVTSLQWNRNGTILASAALGENNIILWDAEEGVCLHLLPAHCTHRILSFKLASKLLLSERADEQFGMWHSECRCEHVNWLCRIQSAAWIVCDKYLLFVYEGSSILCATADSMEIAVSLMQLSVVSCNGQQRACGEPQAIAVDPLNIYVAVIFKWKPFVLVCLLNMRQDILVIPLDFIASPQHSVTDYATCMSFGCNTRNPPTLAIAWASGRIQHYQLPQSFDEANQQTNFRAVA